MGAGVEGRVPTPSLGSMAMGPSKCRRARSVTVDCLEPSTQTCECRGAGCRRAFSELQRNRDPYLSRAASIPARGVTDTLAPRTLRSNPARIRTKHL